MKMIVSVALLALLIPLGVIQSRRGVSENRVEGQIDSEAQVDRLKAGARSKTRKGRTTVTLSVDGESSTIEPSGSKHAQRDMKLAPGGAVLDVRDGLGFPEAEFDKEMAGESTSLGESEVKQTKQEKSKNAKIAEKAMADVARHATSALPNPRRSSSTVKYNHLNLSAPKYDKENIQETANDEGAGDARASLVSQDMSKTNFAALQNSSEEGGRDREVDAEGAWSHEKANISFPNFPKLHKPKLNERAFDDAIQDLDAVVTKEDGSSMNIKLWCGQEFLNAELSSKYFDDAGEIKQATGVGDYPTLMKPVIGDYCGKTCPKDGSVWVLSDGHHRILWNAFHGMSTPIKLKTIGGFMPHKCSGLIYGKK